MKKSLLVLLGVALLASCDQARLRGCKSYYRVPDISALNAALTSAKSRWAAADIQNYTYTLGYSASGSTSGNTVTTVRGGQVVPNPAAPFPGRTMDALFAEVTRTIDSAAQPDACVMVKASYDESDGHVLSSSSTNASQGIQDGGGGSYRILSFQRD